MHPNDDRLTAILDVNTNNAGTFEKRDSTSTASEQIFGAEKELLNDKWKRRKKNRGNQDWPKPKVISMNETKISTHHFERHVA